MKAGNIFAIIITAIITFIGLLCTKLYEKYVKKNLLVQGALYAFWTLLVFRLLCWIATPFIGGVVKSIKPFLHSIGTWVKYFYDGLVQMVINANCVILVGVAFIVTMIICTAILRKAADKLGE